MGVAAMLLSGFTVASFGGAVMKARKKCGVPYPNLYASIVNVDGKEYTNAKSVELASEFNNIQRGHQNALESFAIVIGLALSSGLAAPKAAAVGLLLWTVGARFYCIQY